MHFPITAIANISIPKNNAMSERLNDEICTEDSPFLSVIVTVATSVANMCLMRHTTLQESV
jgi:hypothetical protein